MKKVRIIIWILAMSLGFSVNSNAITTFFDFEDGKNVAGALGGLDAYLTEKFGSNVTIVPIFGTATPSGEWFGTEDRLFHGSDILFSLDAGGTIDFDPGYIPSALKITEVSFTWGVFSPSINVDFGLDVFDDVRNRWVNNVFTIWDSRIQTGDSGPIIFGSNLKVTRPICQKGLVTNQSNHDLFAFILWSFPAVSSEGESFSSVVGWLPIERSSVNGKRGREGDTHSSSPRASWC